MAEHTLSAEPTHSRWNKALAPRLIIDSGDVVHLDCVDSSGSQVHPTSTVEDFMAIDRGKIHALTGPIAIHNAESGDTLAIEVLNVAHKGWGWSSTIPGLGFLKDRFNEPFFFPWRLEGSFSRSLEPAVVPLRPFCGVMGVAPAELGEFRTRPPGIFGGNMDVRELCAGATLYLPVLHPGAHFSAGDAHAAQGDGEVCINGIECPADVTLRFHLHKHRALPGPLVETTSPEPASASWVVVESATDALVAARAATNRMIDLLVDGLSIPAVHAYLLCSAAMNLRLSQVVNEPMITVSAALSKSVLPGVETLLAMLINDPETVAELAAIYPHYETALINNDIETMQQLFWASPHVVRFGATESLHGIDQIAAFRASRPAANLARRITRLDISTFGKDFGCVHLEFERDKDGGIVRGRQSQTWVRLPAGWRVVAAHVSLLS